MVFPSTGVWQYLYGVPGRTDREYGICKPCKDAGKSPEPIRIRNVRRHLQTKHGIRLPRHVATTGTLKLEVRKLESQRASLNATVSSMRLRAGTSTISAKGHAQNDERIGDQNVPPEVAETSEEVNGEPQEDGTEGPDEQVNEARDSEERKKLLRKERGRRDTAKHRKEVQRLKQAVSLLQDEIIGLEQERCMLSEERYSERADDTTGDNSALFAEIACHNASGNVSGSFSFLALSQDHDFDDTILGDTVLANLLSGLTPKNALSAANSPMNHHPQQDLHALIFPHDRHAFYNIPWLHMVTKEDIDRLRSDAYLSDQVIQFYLTYIAARAAHLRPPQKVGVVSPQFTGQCLRFGGNQLAELAGPARLSMTGSPGGSEYILIPLFKDAHWMLAIYDAGTHRGEAPVVRYYDPLQNPLADDIRQIIEKIMCAVLQERRLSAAIVEADYGTFNRQSDGFNCGVHVSLVAERYILHSRQTYVPDLDISVVRRKMLNICSIIRGSILLNRARLPLRRLSSRSEVEDFESLRAATVNDLVQITAVNDARRRWRHVRPPADRIWSIEACLGRYYDFAHTSRLGSPCRISNYALFRYAAEDTVNIETLTLISHIIWRVPLWQLAHVARNVSFSDESSETSVMIERFYYPFLEIMGFYITVAVLSYIGLRPEIHFLRSEVERNTDPDDSDPMTADLIKHSGQAADEMRQWKEYFIQPHDGCPPEVIRDVFQSTFGAHICTSFYKRCSELVPAFKSILDNEVTSVLPRELATQCVIQKERCFLRREWEFGDTTGATFDSGILQQPSNVGFRSYNLNALKLVAIKELYLDFNCLYHGDVTMQFLAKLEGTRVEKLICAGFKHTPPSLIQEIKAAKRFALGTQHVSHLFFHFYGIAQLNALLDDRLMLPETAEKLSFIFASADGNIISGDDIALSFRRCEQHPYFANNIREFQICMMYAHNPLSVLEPLYHISRHNDRRRANRGLMKTWCHITHCGMSAYDDAVLRQFINDRGLSYDSTSRPEEGKHVYSKRCDDGWEWGIQLQSSESLLTPHTIAMATFALVGLVCVILGACGVFSGVSSSFATFNGTLL